ncbi:MAG: hypothetical protein K0R67_2954 [Paenibacillus sp.]|nr:hypothetical protein [Paenibacillus sp.]
MQPVDPKPNKRELTYQVGWKKGRMEIGKNGKVTNHRPDNAPSNASALVRFMERTAWKPAFRITDSIMIAILWSVPPVAFFLTWLLVYYLGI